MYNVNDLEELESLNVEFVNHEYTFAPYVGTYCRTPFVAFQSELVFKLILPEKKFVTYLLASENKIHFVYFLGHDLGSFYAVEGI